MNGKGWIAVILIVLLVALGWNSASLSKDESYRAGVIPGIGGGPGDTIPTGTARPSQLRTNLQILLAHHGTLANAHLETLYEGRDTSQTAQSLEENTQELVETFEQLGANREQFLNMWRAHIAGYEEYTKALKNNDQGAKDAVLDNLDNMAVETGRMINQIIPAVPVEVATPLMEEHIVLTLAIIEAHGAGSASDKAALITNSTTQALRFADILTDGIESSI